ncbi:metallophosphoesterase family protein [Pedobacter faecalis]|uniref:metallophosphoesterase family protein n=1 Tax=Pedobacter faecalis TaxID=3041495 RepID=UPI00254C4C92|nr:metallophosphoesterase [Pedobacter sp. ELA7]
MRLSFFLFLCLVLAGCNHFEFSPNQAFDRNSFRDINNRNLKKLGSGATDDTVRFVLTGDSQKSRDETVAFCKAVNALPGIDFVVLAGDISEFGVLKEMEWISRALEDLNPPYVAVVGNHDLVARGKDVFLNMFGELNYSFTYGGIKFVCHDTNGREYQFNGQTPDMQWLQHQLKPENGVTGYIAISHVPPNNPDFDPGLVKPYTDTMVQTPGLLASLHGHTHQFEEYFAGDRKVPFIITSAMADSEFLVIEVVNNNLTYKRVSF